MKKLLLATLLLAAAAFSVSAADPIGVEVGTDVKIFGFESDLGVSAKPFVAYKRTVAGIDGKATLSYGYPVYEDFLIDEGTIGVKVYGSKTFTLNDTFTLTPGLTVAYGYDTAAEEDESSFELDPEVTLAYGKFYTLLTGITGLVPESTFTLYVEEGTSIGAFSPYVFLDYAISPDVEFADFGLGASYGWNAWTFLAEGSFSGFGDDEDVAYAQLLKVKYSF
jgi:hypothetical protein